MYFNHYNDFDQIDRSLKKSKNSPTIKWKCDQKTWQCNPNQLESELKSESKSRIIGEYYNNKNTCLINCNPLKRLLPNNLMDIITRKYLPIQSFPNLSMTNKYFHNTAIIKQKNMEYHLLKINKNIENFLIDQIKILNELLDRKLLEIKLLESNSASIEILYNNLSNFNQYLTANLNDMTTIFNQLIRAITKIYSKILIEIFEDLSKNIEKIMEFGIIILILQNRKEIEQYETSIHTILDQFLDLLDSMSRNLFENQINEFDTIDAYLNMILIEPHTIFKRIVPVDDLKSKYVGFDSEINIPAESFQNISEYFNNFISPRVIKLFDELLLPILNDQNKEELKIFRNIVDINISDTTRQLVSSVMLILLFTKQQIIRENNGGGGFKIYDWQELSSLSSLIQSISIYINKNIIFIDDASIIILIENLSYLTVEFLIYILSTRLTMYDDNYYEHLLTNLIYTIFNVFDTDFNGEIKLVLKPIFKYFGLWNDRNNIIISDFAMMMMTDIKGDESKIEMMEEKEKTKDNLAKFLILLFILLPIENIELLFNLIFEPPAPDETKIEDILLLLDKLDNIFYSILPRNDNTGWYDFMYVYTLKKYLLLYAYNDNNGLLELMDENMIPNLIQQSISNRHPWSHFINLDFIRTIPIVSK